MMPADGGPGRGLQMATLERIVHERATADEVGGWLDALEGDDGLVGARPRRGAARAPRLGARAARAGRPRRRAGAGVRPTGRPCGRRRGRRTTSRRWRRRCGATSSSRAPTPPASTASPVPTTRCSPTTTSGSPPRASRRCSGGWGRRCRRCVAGARPRRRGTLPQPSAEAQRKAVPAVLARLGRDTSGWRIDVSAHPFSACVGHRDSRVTTRYEEGDLLSVLAAVHEFGHALYERQIPAELSRTNLGGGDLDVDPRVPEQAVGEPRRAAIRRSRRCSPTSSPPPARRSTSAALHASLVGGPPVADPRLRRPGHLSAAHRAALRARAGADRGHARRRRPPRGVERRHAPAARRRGARRRRRRPAGPPLGGGRVRLLPELRARVPDRRAAVGGARARPRLAGRGARRR